MTNELLISLLIVVSSLITIFGFFANMLNSFKKDIRKDIEKLEDRMFQLATGKSLKDAILEERMKEKK